MNNNKGYKHSLDTIDDCIEYCKYQFEYGQRQSDGATVKEHIEAAMASPFAATLGEKQKQLQEEQERGRGRQAST